MMTGARTPLTVDLSDQRVAITAGANGIGKLMADSFVRAARACSSQMSMRRSDHQPVIGCWALRVSAACAYSAAKWGVVGFTKSLSMELGPDSIRVNAILPGPVDGPRIRAVIRAKADAAGVSENEMTERTVATTSLRCFVTQQDIANMALYLASPFGATISGQAISVDADMQTTM
jgi:NAD(P)-dependent dehydrogenase (short-subunit alcohol dehydrogenase family)